MGMKSILREAVVKTQMERHRSQWYNLRPILGCAN